MSLKAVMHCSISDPDLRLAGGRLRLEGELVLPVLNISFRIIERLATHLISFPSVRDPGSSPEPTDDEELDQSESGVTGMETSCTRCTAGGLKAL
jgi:hypothetical protein